MSKGKISTTPNTGMRNLIEQAEGNGQPAADAIPQWPENKCLKVRCILEAVDYYIPNGDAGVAADQPPYFPFGFAIGYSEVRDPGTSKIISIIKHEQKRFFQTGISAEIVNLPMWWAKRDDGII